MRSQNQIEGSSAYSNLKKRASTTASTVRNHINCDHILGSVGGGGSGGDSIKSVMEFPDGAGQERQQQQQQQQQQQRLQRTFPSQHSHPQHSSQQEARQPQHLGFYSQPHSYHSSQQQPPPPPHQAPPPPASSSASAAAAGYPRGRSDHPPDINMTSSTQSLDRDYLQQQQRQAQQYLHHHGGHYGAAAGVAGYSGAAAAARQYAAAAAQQHQQHHQQAISYQQQLAMQQQYGAAAAGYAPSMDQHMGHPPQTRSSNPHHSAGPAQAHVLQQPYLQPKIGRLPADRPLIKLSVSLIDTYKQINTIYYEERDARRAARAKEKAKNKSSGGDTRNQSQAFSSKKPADSSDGQSGSGGGTTNNGWDDENYDYIITEGELFYGRYRIKGRIGKGSFGQVVRAEDTREHKDVAIKIIKSKKPFLMQAKTEIELLSHLNEKDMEDQHNIVRLLTHFMYRNHQCLVFEMLSLNLYELLKNTQFGGVSLNLIRKFAKQVLKSLSFLARKDVDVIHCDLKPENILLRHPKKSGIKVIDFGSSCRSDRRMYSYIQSRFYRSPEVMLGLPYAVSIDMWSLGCILAEMHTGEPLFSGSDQFDQMQKIVKILGMVPSAMLDKANDTHRLQFFERVRSNFTDRDEWCIKQTNTSSSSRGGSSSANRQQSDNTSVVEPSTDPIASLSKVIKKHPPSESGNSPRNYQLFVDLVYRMLAYDPAERIKADEALNHPFIVEPMNR